MMYKWIGIDGGWKIGRSLVDVLGWDHGQKFTNGLTYVAMQHYQTREIEWVEDGKLSAYPLYQGS